MSADMNQLLQWGIANSVPESGDASELHKVAEDIKSGNRADLSDPGLLEAIMGKSDATLMKEAMTAAVDESLALDQREIALDNLEMMIESIDNANDMQKLGLWPPLVKLLEDSSDQIRQQAAWVAGTAVQNNPKAQEAFLEHNPLPILLAMISTTDERPASVEGLPNLPRSSAELRSRSLYCLSGTVKHNEKAVLSLDDHEGWGWDVLKGALSDPSLTIRRKAAFLLSTILLLVPLAGTATGFAPYDPTVPTSPSTSKRILISFSTHSIPSTLLASLSPERGSHPAPGPNADEPPASDDADYREKAARVLVSLVERKGLGGEEKSKFRELVKGWEKEEGGLEGTIGVGQEEEKELKTVLDI